MSNNYSFEVLHWEKNFGKPLENWTYFPIDKLIKERKDSRVNDGSLKLCSLTIEEGVVEKSDRYNREFLLKNQEENKYKCVHPNDIVINPMNLRFGAIAKSEQVDPVLVSGYYNVVSASKLVDTDYLSAFLKSAAMSYMYERVALGSLNEKKRVHLSELKKIVVPIPSIKEQLKIGQILSTWDKAIATTEKLIDASKQQKKALMQQLLTGKKRLVDPETGKAFEGEWEEVKLDDVSSKVMVGIASAATHAYTNSGIRMLRNLNIKDGWIDDSDMLYISEEYEIQHKNKRLKAGDILTVRTGYPGLSAVVPSKYDQAQCFTSLITRLNQDRAMPEFVCRYINSEYGKKFITSGEAGGAQKNVNAGMLKLMPLPLPSLAEQQKIASVLTTADKDIELLETKLANLKLEKKALMQQLLTGKRRVKVDTLIKESLC